MPSRVLAAVGFACPLVLVVIVLLMRARVITFSDDFTGFKGLGFLITCLAVAVPAGLAASAGALWMDRRSLLAWAAMAVNALLAAGALFLMADLTF
jgi:hypothetical protein